MLQPGEGKADLELESERNDDPDLETAMPPLESSMPVDLPAKAVTPCPGAVPPSDELRKHGPRRTKEGEAVRPVPDVKFEVKQTVEIELRSSSRVAQRYQQSDLYKPKPRAEESTVETVRDLRQSTNPV